MSTPDPLIGKQLGDYKIEGLIGHGGMARVYRGYDEKLDRNAAVKVIEPTLIAGGEEEEYRDRFLREARSIARLNHPNIVGVYQFAQEENLYFIAMAYLDGRDLREILKENAEEGKVIPQEQMISILRDIAKGLDYAHKNDIIHRDIKPSNIIITNEGNAVLTDFGLALNAAEGTIGNTFGSVHYIAPEQAISSAQSVPQSDQYSLGVIVYELLAGQVPFDDASAMSVALKHISDPPPPIRDLNSKVTPVLEAVVMRALDKEPTNRYDTVSAFVDELEQALADSPDALMGQSVTGRPVNTPPVSPSMDDDAPTLADSESRPQVVGITSPTQQSTKVPPDRQNEGNRNTTFAVLGIVIVVAVIVGGLLASNSAAQATAATETAVAETTGTAIILAQNSTATENANIANTATSEFENTQEAIANSTSTAIAQATSDAMTQMAIENSTSTAEFEATQTEISNDRATSTAEFEATQTVNANNTSTAEFEATETAIANEESTATAESEATQTEIANDRATSTSQANATNRALTSIAQENATSTESVIQTREAVISPTPTPTLTPSLTPTFTATVTLTPTATLVPTSTPTTIPLVAQAGEEELLLRYDGRSILLTNRAQDSRIFIDSLVFTKFVTDEDGEVVEAGSYRMSQFSGAPASLRTESCLQLWDSRQFSRPSENNRLKNNSCDIEPFWRTTLNAFWIDDSRDNYFEVTVNGVDFLTRCPTNRTGSLIEQRCVVSVP